MIFEFTQGEGEPKMTKPHIKSWHALAAASVALGVFAVHLHAIEEPGNRHLTSGPVGITRFDTIRLNALCSEVNPGPCIVNFLFEDPGNRVLKQATMTLLPGQAGHLDVAAAEVASLFRDQTRVEVLPMLQFARGTRVLGNIEEFDTASSRNFAVTVVVDDPTNFVP
jgi:hypothetical protein